MAPVAEGISSQLNYPIALVAFREAGWNNLGNRNPAGHDVLGMDMAGKSAADRVLTEQLDNFTGIIQFKAVMNHWIMTV